MFCSWIGNSTWIGVSEAIHMPRLARLSQEIQAFRTCTDGSASASGTARCSSVDWFVMTPPRTRAPLS